MFEEALSLLSIWASMNSWLTPTVLFLLLNLMIGTIAVTSGFTSHKPTHHHHHHHNNHHEPIFHHHHNHQSQPHIQTHLTRSPSVLQRLKSFNFSAYLQQPPPPSSPQQQQPEPTIIPPEPISTTSSTVDGGDGGVDGGGGEGDDDNPTLDEIYRRIKQESSNPSYGRQNSDTKPSGGEIPVKLPKKMKKSASHKSPFNHFHFDNNAPSTNPANAVESVMEEDIDVEEERENAGGGDGGDAVAPPLMAVEREYEGVDAKADDFIIRFRKQLQLQRNESIVRYKNLISRTTATAQ